jgi:hypothetical protein
MRRYLVITIDTEIDRSKNWGISSHASFKSVTDGIPRILSPLFERYTAVGTYLLSAEVIEHEESAALLGQLRNAEIGTHLHGDFVAPGRTAYSVPGTFQKAKQCGYSPELEFQKLSIITDLFRATFGYQPVSFRAGRFAAGANTIRCLSALQYKVDTSVTPGLAWTDMYGNADFRRAPVQPYFPATNDIQSPGNSDVLEVPVSICPPHVLRVPGHTGAGALRQYLDARNWLRERWLRPSYSSARTMKRTLSDLMTMNKGVVFVANIMFHTMEIIPGASPYALTKRQVDTIVARLDSLLEFCAQQGFVFVKLSDLYELSASFRAESHHPDVAERQKEMLVQRT